MRLPAPAARLLRNLGRPTLPDLASGLVTGLFSIPEGMAYAAIGGFNPVAGLYAGVVPAVVGSLFARTVLMVTTLTSAIALTAQSVLADARLDPHSAGNLAMLAVLTGAVMVLMGALRLGAVMSFVSNAVMTGFSAGIALQIITGVLGDATGYDPHGRNRLYQVGDWLAHLTHWNGTATALAAATIAVWAAARAVPRSAPVALLIAMVAASLGSAALGLHVETVRSIAAVPAALPHLTVPDLAAAPHLVVGALSVALVALAQAAGIGPTVPNPDGSRSSVNGDFAAQGAANLIGGLFQSLPAGGSLSRTGVAVDAGARTRWAGILSGVWLALIVLAAGSLAERIPMPVIGGLILVVGGELLWGRRSDAVLVARTSPLSTAAMVLTFAATTQLPLQRAILIGAVLSLLLYCAQAARQAGFTALERGPDGRWRTADRPAAFPPRAVTVLHYTGVSLFAEAPRLDAEWPSAEGADGARVIVTLRGLPDVPSSAVIKMLRRRAAELAATGGRLTLVGVPPRLAHVLRTTGLTRTIPLTPAEPTVFAALDKAVAAEEAELDRQAAEDGTP